MARNPNASLQDRANVAHALFSMTKLAGRADVRQQQMLRMLSQMPPVPTHEIDTGDSRTQDSGTDKTVPKSSESLREVGSDEWKLNLPNESDVQDNMRDFTMQDGYEDYARRMQVKNSHINLGINDQVTDADLLELLDDEFGDEIDKLDINSDYLESLRDMMYEDFSEIEYDYATQLQDSGHKFVSPMKVFDDPSILDDEFDQLFDA